MKSVTLRTFALRTGFTEPETILKEPLKYITEEVSVDDKRIGTLYIKDSKSTRPKWLEFFDEVPEIKALNLRNRTHSAVLLVETAGRRFALSFGYGYSMIEPAAIKRRFGLRAALNLVDPEQIRSMDRKRLESVTMYTGSKLAVVQGSTLLQLMPSVSCCDRLPVRARTRTQVRAYRVRTPSRLRGRRNSLRSLRK